VHFGFCSASDRRRVMSPVVCHQGGSVHVTRSRTPEHTRPPMPFGPAKEYRQKCHKHISRRMQMARTIVIGAGFVGLSTAWFLQQHGVEVTVVDRTAVAAGSPWGNAGWLTPGKAIPLADPSLWTYGPRALIDPDAALHVPFRVDAALWGFLARFAAHGTHRAWDRTMAALTPIDRRSEECFDELGAGGVDAWTREGPCVIGFAEEAPSPGFLRE